MEILYTKKEIQDRVRQLAIDVALDYKDSLSIRKPVFVCVLNGGFMFFNDLVRNLHKLNIDGEHDFIRIKSYIGKFETSEPVVVKDFEVDLQHREVYIIDDMCETGTTLQLAKELALKHNPSSVKIVTMIEREHKARLSDFVGFVIKSDQWLVGYGLDNDQYMRAEENIYTIN